MRVGTDSSAAAGITERLGSGRVRHLEVKDLWIQEKVRSHELKISRVKPEYHRADLLTKFSGPRTTSQTAQAVSNECARDKARGGKFSSVGSGVLVVTSQSYSRQSDRNGWKIEEMSVAAGWLARGSRTQVVEFWEMTTWILWWARWMPTVGVGC